MLTTFLNTLRTQLRRPGTLVWVLAFPIILCTIFLFMFSGLSTDGMPDPVPVAVVALVAIGALMSMAIFPGNAEKYSNVLKTDTLEFAQDIKEVNYSEIPVIDRDSAILLGNREMGSIPEYVSQFEVSNLYSQINYQGTPVRVSPLGYADLFKWFTNREGGIPAYALVNMTTQADPLLAVRAARAQHRPPRAAFLPLLHVRREVLRNR